MSSPDVIPGFPADDCHVPRTWRRWLIRALFWCGLAFCLYVCYVLWHYSEDLRVRLTLGRKVDVGLSIDRRGELRRLKLSVFDLRRLTLDPADLEFLSTHSRLDILEVNAPYIGKSKWWEREDCGISIPYGYRCFARFVDCSDADTTWMNSSIGRQQMRQLCAVVRQSLQGVEHDRELPISLGSLDDRMLEHIRRCHRLKALFLAGNPITNEGLKKLENLDELVLLSLEGTQISDEGLASVARLRSLKMLVLINTRITDSGLTQLEPLQQLAVLTTSGTRVTEAGLKRLQEKIPTLGTEGACDIWNELADASMQIP